MTMILYGLGLLVLGLVIGFYYGRKTKVLAKIAPAAETIAWWQRTK